MAPGSWTEKHEGARRTSQNFTNAGSIIGHSPGGFSLHDPPKIPKVSLPERCELTGSPLKAVVRNGAICLPSLLVLSEVLRDVQGDTPTSRRPIPFGGEAAKPPIGWVAGEVGGPLGGAGHLAWRELGFCSDALTILHARCCPPCRARTPQVRPRSAGIRLLGPGSPLCDVLKHSRAD